MPRHRTGAVKTAFRQTKRRMGRKSGSVAKPKTKAQRQRAFKGR